MGRRRPLLTLLLGGWLLGLSLVTLHGSPPPPLFWLAVGGVTVTPPLLIALIAFDTEQRRALTGLITALRRVQGSDLATPIPAARHELAPLAHSLEQARLQLHQHVSELERSQRAAETILTGIVEGVFTVDRSRRIQYLNPQAAAMLGTTVAAATGQFCGDVLRPEGPGGVRPCAEHCPIIHARFRDGARATEHVRLPMGEQRILVVTSAPAAGAVQVQVLRDETATEAVRQLRDAVLANISHEFRTPLSAQQASLELLLDQLPDLGTPQIATLLQALQRGTLRLTRLIDNLLESAQLEAGQQRIRHQPVALDDVIEDAIELMRPLLSQRGQRIEVELPYPLPTLTGDGPRLTQVFVNLLANSNKYAPAGSLLQVGGSVAPAALTVWLSDEGPGISQGAAVWERFVRPGAHDPEQSGVGLGLWIVRSIIERHGGTVVADSSPAGTTMRLTLPYEAQP